MQIVFVRHTSVDVARGVCYGQTDVPLSSTFSQEAAATLSALRPLMPFDKAFSSPLSRAVRLAEYCGFEAAVRDDRLKEMSMGEWEMKRYEEIADPQLQRWYADYMHEPTSGGESFPDLYRRVSNFLDELRRSPLQRVVVFTHAGVIIAAGIYAGLFSEDNAFAHQTPYGGIKSIEIIDQ